MSTYPHRINLRGPWQCETLDTASPKRVQRVTMPCRWADTPLKDCTGRIRCQRCFHWQKPLDANERLFLVVGAADFKAEVTLNGHCLGSHEGAFDPFEFEVTRLIQASNDLCIDLDSYGVFGPSNFLPITGHIEASNRPFISLGSPRGLWGTVFLEVRRESFLQQVDINVTWKDKKPQLEVSGLVVGPDDRPVDVDVLLSNTLLNSRPVKASPQGEPFNIRLEIPDIERWYPASLGEPRLHYLRLELLDAHSRLYVQSEPIGFRQVSPLENPNEVLINGHRCLLPKGWVLDEPLLESPTLDQADLEGRLLRVCPPVHGGSGKETALRLLRRHPSVVDIHL